MAVISTLDCSNGLQFITPANFFGATNPYAALFTVDLLALEQNGLTKYSNFTPCIVHNGDIYSTYIPYNEAISTQYVATNYFGINPEIQSSEPIYGIPNDGEIEFYILNGDKVYQLMNPTNFMGSQVSTFLLYDSIITNSDSFFQLYCTLQLTDLYDTFSELNIELVTNLAQNQETIDVLGQENNEIANEVGLSDNTTESLQEVGINISDLENTQVDIELEEENQDTSQINDNIDNQISILEESSDIIGNIPQDVLDAINAGVIDDAINAQPVNISSKSKLNLKNIIIAGLGGAVLLSLLKK